MKVMVFGTFDDLHPGHRYLLSEAMKRAKDETSVISHQSSADKNNSKLIAHSSQLFVVVARDSNVQRIKGRTALQPEDVRAQAIREAFPQAEVMLGNPDNFLWPIREVKPDLILLGYDQKLPPGVLESDLGVRTERLDAFDPHIHKSSLRRERTA